MRVFIEGIGLLGPGLDGWEASRTVLAGKSDYSRTPTVIAPDERLPAAERRRTATPVKLALAVGRQACIHAQIDVAVAASVFASADADADSIHQICEALASSEREVSPTRFHNSVHNAPAGYWGIAAQSHAASTSLCCNEASFAAGLLEAVAQAVSVEEPVILIAYDQRYAEPLGAVRGVGVDFGVALVLASVPSAHSLSSLELTFVARDASDTTMSEPELEALRNCVSAARCLPLLSALSRGEDEIVTLGYLAGGHLRAEVAPC